MLYHYVMMLFVLGLDKPWSVHGYKMRFDSTQWYPASNPEPVPVRGMSYLLMCETHGAPKPLPKIKWLRDGRPITNTKHFYIIVSSLAISLSLSLSPSLSLCVCVCVSVVCVCVCVCASLSLTIFHLNFIS